MSIARSLCAGLAVLFVVSLPASAAISYTYDALGRLVRVDYAVGNYVTYKYDAAGNRIQVGNASTNVAPVAANDAISVFQGTPTTFDPRTNDLDADYDPLTITAKTDGAHGTVAINSGASLTFTPTAGYHGTDTFTYTISDGAGHTASATVTATIVNRPPLPGADAISSPAGAAVTFDPRSNDTDPEGDALTVTGKTNGAHGTVTFTSTSLTYTPASGYFGTDTFTYTVSDGQGNTAIGHVTASVGTVPVAVDDTLSASAIFVSTPVTPLGAQDVVANDHDADGDTLSVIAVSAPAHGTASIVNSTTVQYIYGSAVHTTLSTTDSFTYTITDTHGNHATATVNVIITVTKNDNNN